MTISEAQTAFKTVFGTRWTITALDPRAPRWRPVVHSSRLLIECHRLNTNPEYFTAEGHIRACEPLMALVDGIDPYHRTLNLVLRQTLAMPTSREPLPITALQYAPEVTTHLLDNAATLHGLILENTLLGSSSANPDIHPDRKILGAIAHVFADIGRHAHLTEISLSEAITDMTRNGCTDCHNRMCVCGLDGMHLVDSRALFAA